MEQSEQAGQPSTSSKKRLLSERVAPPPGKREELDESYSEVELASSIEGIDLVEEEEPEKQDGQSKKLVG